MSGNAITVIRSGSEAVVVDPSRQVDRYVDFVRAHGAHIVRVLALKDEDLRPFRIRTDGSGILPVELTPIGPPRAGRDYSRSAYPSLGCLTEPS